MYSTMFSDSNTHAMANTRAAGGIIDQTVIQEQMKLRWDLWITIGSTHLLEPVGGGHGQR
jgi:hypothetical protein